MADFISMSLLVKNWTAIAKASNGDMYVPCGYDGVYSEGGNYGPIYKQTGGVGALVALDLGLPLTDTYLWSSIAAASDGDVYACTTWNNGLQGSIYKQTSGSGDFVDLVQSPGSYNSWYGVAAAPNGNIYALQYDDLGDGTTDVYMQTSGSGDFVSLNQSVIVGLGSKFSCIAVAPNGDVYAGLGTNYEGTSGLYKQTGGVGDFEAIVQESLNGGQWSAITTTSDGSIYVAVYGQGIWKQTSGSGDFELLSLAFDRQWSGLASDASGNIYASVYGDDIYKMTNAVSPPTLVSVSASLNTDPKNTLTWTA
jgi:hypothetical protein